MRSFGVVFLVALHVVFPRLLCWLFGTSVHKIGYVCQEKRERARLCSMYTQVALWATWQKDNAFSLSVEGKQGREYNNAQ